MDRSFLIPYVSALHLIGSGTSPDQVHEIRLIPVSGEFLPEFERAFAQQNVKVLWQPIADWSTGTPHAQAFIEQVFRILYRNAHDADDAYAAIQSLAQSFQRADDAREHP